MKTVDEYILMFSPDVRAILQKIRRTVLNNAPGALESISYQMPTYSIHGRILVHFAAHKNHIGFYATPSGHHAFQKELAGYKGGKGSVQFPLNQQIPYDLIARIVQFRVEENKMKATSSGK